jgi:hypothetical protein
MCWPLPAQPLFVAHSPGAVGSLIGAIALTQHETKGATAATQTSSPMKVRATYGPFVIWSRHEKVEETPVSQGFSIVQLKYYLRSR